MNLLAVVPNITNAKSYDIDAITRLVEITGVPGFIWISVVLSILVLIFYIVIKYIEIHRDGLKSTISDLNISMNELSENHANKIDEIHVSYNNHIAQLNITHDKEQEILKKKIEIFKNEDSMEIVDIYDVLSNLKHHPYFDNLDYYKDVKIPYTVFTNTARRELYKDYFQEYLTILKKSYIHLLEEKDILECGIKSIKNKINAIHMQIEPILYTALSNLGLPEIVIQKLTEVHELYSAMNSVFINVIFDEDSNEILNSLCIYKYLNFSIHLLEIMTTDFANKLENFNGELTGVLYKGVEL